MDKDGEFEPRTAPSHVGDLAQSFHQASEHGPVPPISRSLMALAPFSPQAPGKRSLPRVILDGAILDGAILDWASGPP